MDEWQWAEKQVEETIKRREMKELADRKMAAEEALKRVLAPGLWSELKSLMKSRVESFGEALGEQDILEWSTPKANRVVIKVKDGTSQIEAIFELERFRLVLQMTYATAEYGVQIEDGEAVFAERGEAHTAEAIAERFVEDIIKYC
jgi:acetyl-CoA carboxylase carboxyltransferase component